MFQVFHVDKKSCVVAREFLGLVWAVFTSLTYYVALSQQNAVMLVFPVLYARARLLSAGFSAHSHLLVEN